MNKLKPQENTQRNEPHNFDDSGNAEQRPRVRGVSVDAFIDELFGLNWKVIKTPGVAFTCPTRLAQAGRRVAWEDRYIPFFRLWFTLDDVTNA